VFVRHKKFCLNWLPFFRRVGKITKSDYQLVHFLPYVLYVRPSVRMEQLGSHWRDFYEILYLRIFRKSVKKFKFHQNLTRITGTLHEERHTFLIISRPVFLRMRNISYKFVDEIKTHILCSTYFFFRKWCLCEIKWKNIIQPDRPQMTMWLMRIACWITKATNTHSQYVILIAFPLQQWLKERSLTHSLPASTLVDLTFQTRALRSFSLNQLRNLSL